MGNQEVELCANPKHLFTEVITLSGEKAIVRKIFKNTHRQDITRRPAEILSGPLGELHIYSDRIEVKLYPGHEGELAPYIEYIQSLPKKKIREGYTRIKKNPLAPSGFSYRLKGFIVDPIR